MNNYADTINPKKWDIETSKKVTKFEKEGKKGFLYARNYKITDTAKNVFKARNKQAKLFKSKVKPILETAKEDGVTQQLRPSSFRHK